MDFPILDFLLYVIDVISDYVIMNIEVHLLRTNLVPFKANFAMTK